MKNECRCPQCVLENNNGICDRKDCCNYQSELKTPERSVVEIVEDVIKLAKELVMADSIQESAIATMNFRKGVTQTLQAERQKREEVVEAERERIKKEIMLVYEQWRD
jgi:hypothetical protein